MEPSGKLGRYSVRELALTGDVGESEPIRELLTNFYQDVAAENAAEGVLLFADQALEQQQGNGYVSATACQRCHEQEYLQWSATRHAFAYETLLKKGRYFDAGCVSCHTTGLDIRRDFILVTRIQRSKGYSVKRAMGPASSMSVIRKRVISATVRIHLYVWRVTIRSIPQGSRRWCHCTRRMSIIAANR